MKPSPSCARYISGFTPSFSACTDRAVSLPSSAFTANTSTAAPGLSKLRSPGMRLTMRASGPTSMACSPP